MGGREPVSVSMCVCVHAHIRHCMWAHRRESRGGLGLISESHTVSFATAVTNSSPRSREQARSDGAFVPRVPSAEGTPPAASAAQWGYL